MGDSFLLVKMSSLGDVVHTFAAVRDFKRENPTAKLTWAVEEAYLPLVTLQPDVDNIIPIPLRRLRNNSQCWFLSRSWREFCQNFSQQTYDCAIDAQGLLKSALLIHKANTPIRYGLDWQSIREPLASLIYQKRFHIPKNQHAIIRNRQLFAQAFDYQLNLEQIDFGLRNISPRKSKTPYLLFFHGTTWKSKALPIKIWQQLKMLALNEGYHVYLPWGNVAEKQQAEEIMGESERCHILPPLGLAELAKSIAESAGAISVDTGLGHLAAAFDLPVIGVFGATSPVKSGILGIKSKNLGGENPCYKKDCRTHGGKLENSCMQHISANEIWQNWQLLRHEN